MVLRDGHRSGKSQHKDLIMAMENKELIMADKLENDTVAIRSQHAQHALGSFFGLKAEVLE